MCGRVFQIYNANQLLRIAGTKLIQNDDKNNQSYNIPPTEYLPVIKHTDDAKNNNRVVDIMQWGFQPFGRLLFNARGEDPQKKNVFKNLVESRRCVVIVEGYFEWTRSKVGYVFRPKESKEGQEKLPHIFLAGIYSKTGAVIIITRDAFGDAKKAHHRMPVILGEDEIDKWLNCEKYSYEDLQEEIVNNEKSKKWKDTYCYQVKSLVNSVENKSKEVLDPRDEKEISDYDTKAAASTKTVDVDADDDHTKRGDETDNSFFGGDDDDDDNMEEEKEDKDDGKKKVTPAKKDDKVKENVGKNSNGKKKGASSKKRKELDGRDDKNEFTPTTKRLRNNNNNPLGLRNK